MRTLTVDLGDRSYPIFIGPDLVDRADLYRPYVHGRQVMVVTNETVGPLYLERVIGALADFRVETVVLPDGEQYKNLDVLDRIYTALLEARFDRRCTLVALGGGVVGDMTGYAAASYQRGVNFIQVPTTLLSQVDSSVGGKTGVNHALGKNMIGAFHQPQCVIADTATLNTLPDRELSAGLAEVIKYGLINDPEFFTWLETAMPKLRQRDPDALSHAIERSCADKAAIVAADELEAGQRALLNLGHTFGHAIETGMGYGTWLHGEAVAAGMCMAAAMSARLGWLTPSDVEQVRRVVASAGLPVDPPPEVSAQRFSELMAVDKKVMDGKMRLVLMQGLGQSVISGDFDRAALDQTLHER
ncbi:MAG: 3-dehydroquinate synthase [Gammaproteobacteria bacterium]|nr:3-dehydroquinate synthase [Gammaproteobacteria bacterium]